MHYILENETYKATISSKGAELVSLLNKTENLEYIWQADPNIWPRHTPVLFPIVGRLVDDQFTHEGQTYKMSQHGFARDLEFTKVPFGNGNAQLENVLLLELTETAETLQKYPFNFRLQLKFVLIGNRLEVHYEVENTGQNEQFFSIGAHPGFRCPLFENENYTDYYLEFEHQEILNRYLLENGLQTGETEKVETNSKALSLNHDLFEQDAIVLKNLKSEWVELRSKNHNHNVKVEFKGFPYLGIWAKGHGNFVCIEPWLGIADSINGPVELSEKEGILKLQTQEIFGCKHVLVVS